MYVQKKLGQSIPDNVFKYKYPLYGIINKKWDVSNRHINQLAKTKNVTHVYMFIIIYIYIKGMNAMGVCYIVNQAKWCFTTSCQTVL